MSGGDQPAPASTLTLTFTEVNWSIPQKVTIEGQSDSLIDGNQAITISTAAAASSNTDYNGLNPPDVSVTITDTDTAGITILPTSGLVTTEAGATDSFTVVLNILPTADVTLGLATSDATEVLVQGGDSPGTPVAAITLTFTSANWSTPQTVTVVGQDDLVIDGGQSVSIVSAAAASEDVNLNGLDPSDVSVSNSDNDSAGISVTPASGLVTTEAGGTDSFTVVLDTQPTAPVNISVSSSDSTEVLVDTGAGAAVSGVLNFTTVNWSTPQTVTVLGQDDVVDDGNQGVTIVTAPATSTDGNYNGLNASDVSAKNNHDDAAGISVTPTTGLVTTEGGAPDSFTVVLDTHPTADVTIGISSSDTTEVLVQGGDSPGTPVAAITMTFTAADWSTPQTVTVVGQDDLINDGDIVVTIATGDPVSPGSAAYDALTALSVADVTATNLDDDTPPAVPTVITPATTPIYTQTSPVTIAGGKDANSSIWIDQNGSKAQAVPTDALTTWSVSRALIVNTANNFIITSKDVTGLLESTAVSIQIIHDTIDPAAVTITQPSVSPYAFGGDNLVIAGSCEVGATVDLTGADTQSQSCPAGTFSFTVTKLIDATYNFSLTQTDLAGNVSAAATLDWVRQAPSITVIPVTLTVSEIGPAATFSVVLSQAVNNAVVIDIINYDTTEVSLDKTTLTFGTGNWSIAQTVTVTGIDDLLGDGNQVVTLGVDINLASTTDSSGYSVLNPSDVLVTVLDVANPGVTVFPATALTVNESGTTDTFSVVLNTLPTGDVVIDLISLDTTEVSVSVPSLTFTTGDWSVPQIVTLTGVDDLVVDGALIVTVDISVNTGSTADVNYQILNPSDILVTVVDNDAIGVTVSPSTPLSLSESGTTANLSIVLNTAPDNDVVIDLTSSDLTEAIVSPASMTFTSVNWAAPQTATVTGVDDVLVDGNRTVTIALDINTGSTLDTTGYASLIVPDMTAVVSDDDAAGITVTPATGLFTSESGAIATFTVVLNTVPDGDVVIDIVSTDLSEVSVDKSQITFTAVDWLTPQIVTISGLSDLVVDGNQTVQITLDVNAGATLDTTGYALINPPDVTVENIDNDVAGVTLNPATGLFTSESGSTTSFTVQLNTQPVGGDVVILVLSGDSGEVTVDKSSLTFTSLDWFTPQTVTLTGINDGVADGNQVVTISLIMDTILTLDTSGYLTVNPPDATVTNTENTPFVTVSPTTGLVTSESGATAAFSVVLNTAPTGDVLVNVAAGVPAGEVSSDFNQLIFTTSDWSTPQTVTLTGLDDAATDGSQTVLFALTVDGGTADTDYLALDPDDVTVTNMDDDSIAITVTPVSGLVTTEVGGVESFSVSLSLPPNGTVVIDVASDTPTEVDVDKSILTFTTGDWQTTQTVTMQGQNDAIADGDQAATIVLTMNGLTTDTLGYALLNPDDVAVTNLDNEASGEGSPASPLDVTASLPYSGSVDSGLSYYVVTGLTPGADYYVSINSLTDDLILSVYEDAFTTLSCGPADQYSDARPETCTAGPIPTTTLYIAVDGVNAASGATFTVDVIPAPTAEGAVGAPLDITASLPGYLGGVDSTNSYYVVTGLTPNQPYLVQLSALTDNVDLYVHDNANFNSQLCKSNTSTIAESCTATSNGLGELYIRVAAKNISAATFTVDVSLVPVDEGTSASPLDITGMLPYDGQIITGDPAGSYYVISGLIPGSPYTINLNNMSGFAHLEVYDDLFTNLICSSNNPGNLPESCSAGVFANGSGKIYIHPTCNTGTFQADGASYTIQLQ